jgi:hypothetical protein
MHGGRNRWWNVEDVWMKWERIQLQIQKIYNGTFFHFLCRIFTEQLSILYIKWYEVEIKKNYKNCKFLYSAFAHFLLYLPTLLLSSRQRNIIQFYVVKKYNFLLFLQHIFFQRKKKFNALSDLLYLIPLDIEKISTNIKKKNVEKI